MAKRNVEGAECRGRGVNRARNRRGGAGIYIIFQAAEYSRRLSLHVSCMYIARTIGRDWCLKFRLFYTSLLSIDGLHPLTGAVDKVSIEACTSTCVNGIL